MSMNCTALIQGSCFWASPHFRPPIQVLLTYVTQDKDMTQVSRQQLPTTLPVIVEQSYAIHSR